MQIDEETYIFMNDLCYLRASLDCLRMVVNRDEKLKDVSKDLSSRIIKMQESINAEENNG